jgi:hypothetical protein
MTPKRAAATSLDTILARPGGLYDSATGAPFTPRDANYVQLAKYSNGSAYHSRFEPGLYGSARARAVLDNMKTSSGYNTVRVFIDPGQFITPSHGTSTSVASTAPPGAGPRGVGVRTATGQAGPPSAAPRRRPRPPAGRGARAGSPGFPAVPPAPRTG